MTTESESINQVTVQLTLYVDTAGCYRSIDIDVNGNRVGSDLIGPDRKSAGAALDQALERAAVMALVKSA